MKTTKFHAEEIFQLLETHAALRTEELLKLIGCAPRTLYLKLREHEYMSSINQKRKFLTLSTTPEYDEKGLWEYRGAIFSKWGGIKETIVHLVNSSTMGLTPSQISSLLKTIVTPQLLDCLKEKRMIRIRFGRNQVYFSPDKSISKLQIEKREEYVQTHVKGAFKSSIPQELIPYGIDKVHFGFLAQLILGDALTSDDIYNMLDGMGKSVEWKEVKEIIIRHNIVQKKTWLRLVFLTKRGKNAEFVTEDL